MKGMDLKRTMKFNTPEGSYHSLPVVIEADGSNRLCWFIYDTKVINGSQFIEIEAICWLGDHDSITIKEKKELFVSYCDISTMTNKNCDQYYSDFLFLFANKQFDAIPGLLEKYESEEAVMLYSAIILIAEVI